MAFDGLDYFRQLKPHSFRLDNQALHFFFEEFFLFSRAWFWQRRDYSSHAGLGFEQALLDQVLNHLVSGIGVDFQLGRQRAHGRESLSRKEFAADQGSLCGKHYLIEDRTARAQAKPEQCHTNNVTRVTPIVKSQLLLRGRQRLD